MKAVCTACIQMVLLVLLGLGWLGGIAWADPTDCQPQLVDVVLATPFSSRINRVGNPLQAMLLHAVSLPQGTLLPSGTPLHGVVAGIRAPHRHASGEIAVWFNQTTDPATNIPIGFDAVPATMDGWLRQSDEDTPVWHLSPTRSTRLLNMMVQRRLGSDRAVWAQVLGINQSTIPDPSTDEFMWQYNRHHIMAGAGDRLQLQLRCPSR